MTKRKRRNHTPGFKAKVAIAAIKGDRTLAQLSEFFDVHVNQITTWKAQLEGGAADVFGPGGGTWAMDITYIPMARGFVYLAVVLDWFSRRVLSWQVSITMEAAFCVETLEDALAHHGKPDICNVDQGSQFTGTIFTSALANNSIAISMDGKGAWRDNVFVERLWRSVKYEEVYLRAYDSVSEARASIGRYLNFYNGRRPHTSLDGMTPDRAYLNPLLLPVAA